MVYTYDEAGRLIQTSDSITVLWTREAYEAETGTGTRTVSEAGSPFALIENIFADTSVTDLSSDAYRQVSYVNDINCANTRVLMEYAQNGGMGSSVTAYSYGTLRESYSMTQSAGMAGTAVTGITSVSTGTYYYTGTGSVANLVGSGKNTSYTYAVGGARTAYAMYAAGDAGAAAAGSPAQVGNTYENYGYNGEYTHTDPGIQYLRARYYHMETGTFTSKDTYAGRLTDILSQNRYTYAENNPVTFSDPSGHAAKSGGLSSLQNNIRIANGGNGPALKPVVNNPTAAAKAAYQSRRDAAGLPKENTLLDNIRITNGYERYCELLFQQPDSRLISNLGGFSSQEELVQARIAALQRCLKYNYCLNEVQELIKNKNGYKYFGLPDEYIENIVKSYEKGKNDGNGRYVLDNNGRTIGYGHDLVDGENFSGGLTEEAALELLNQDILKAYRRILNVISALNNEHGYNININDFNQQELTTLVDFSFNRGVGLVQRPDLETENKPYSSLAFIIIAMNNNDTEKVYEILMEEVRTEDGTVSNGLIKRREDEYEIYTKGEYTRKE